MVLVLANPNDVYMASLAEIFLSRYTVIYRVGQNRIFIPYMTVCMVISLLKIPYVHRIYVEIYGSSPPYKKMNKTGSRPV